jgi:sugar lactone lactonase YvrE
MAIVGDTLWVADIDVVRGFDRHSGKAVGVIDFSTFTPTLLNDMGAGPEGVIRVSDTGILMSPTGVIYKGGDRIFEVDAHRRVHVVASGAGLARPNGIAWDARANRWLFVNFAPFESAITALSGNQQQTLLRGPGKYDGVEPLSDGRVLFTCWNDSSLHVFANGRDQQLIRNLPQPADIGVDVRRNRVAIPLSGAGRVEFWALP